MFPVLKYVERVYFSHFISFGAITVAVHIEFGPKNEDEYEHGNNHIHTENVSKMPTEFLFFSSSLFAFFVMLSTKFLRAMPQMALHSKRSQKIECAAHLYNYSCDFVWQFSTVAHHYAMSQSKKYAATILRLTE